MTTLPNTAMAGNGGPALGQWQLPTLKRSCTNRLRLRSLHKPFAACGPLAGSGDLTASSASHVRRGRAAGVRVYQVAREHVLWLRVQQPRLALQVPAQTAPGLSYALHCMTRHMPLRRASRHGGHACSPGGVCGGSARKSKQPSTARSPSNSHSGRNRCGPPAVATGRGARRTG